MKRSYIDNIAATEEIEVQTTQVLSTTPEPTLQAMIEYTFDTKDAYFANPRVNIIERKSTYVKFMIPYNIDTIIISTKDEFNNILEDQYKVVL